METQQNDEKSKQYYQRYNWQGQKYEGFCRDESGIQLCFLILSYPHVFTIVWGKKVIFYQRRKKVIWSKFWFWSITSSSSFWLDVLSSIATAALNIDLRVSLVFRRKKKLTFLKKFRILHFEPISSWCNVNNPLWPDDTSFWLTYETLLADVISLGQTFLRKVVCSRQITKGIPRFPQLVCV